MKQIQLSPKGRFWVLVALSCVAVAWLLLGFYLHHQVTQTRAKLEQERIEASRRGEFLRRGAQYRHDLQERAGGTRVRNAFDGR